MNRFAIKLLTLAMFSMALVVAPALVQTSSADSAQYHLNRIAALTDRS